MNRAITALLSVLLAICPLVAAQTTRPVPQVDRVMIISIDGLRPDVMLRAKAPNLEKLYQGGSFTFWAQTVPVAVTLPSHVSMLTGVAVETHRISFNDDRATTRPLYPQADTIFELAKRKGMTTALVSGKAKFQALNKPGSIDWFWAPDSSKTTDADVAQTAIKVLTEHKPNVMFVHFPGADTTGHAHGWGSPQQFAAIEEIDGYVGNLMSTLRSTQLSESTIVFISADHGGSGKEHGARDPRSLHIPWIVNGPGIRKNFDITSLRPVTVRTEDTFATACFLLGIDPGNDLTGKPITQIVEGYELMRPVSDR